MRPLDPRLIREAKATTWYLATVVALAFLATASTIGIAYSLTSYIVAIFVDGSHWREVLFHLTTALALAALRAAVHFFQEWAGFKASNSVKVTLRERALDRLERSPELATRNGTGALSMLLGPALESLDVYFARYLPQLVFTALVTPAFVALVWLVDFTSVLALIFTIPLIPLFMVLIGLVTRDVQKRQIDALERLNGHFYEILRGIQTLKIFNRTKLQEKVLGDVAMEYRNRTMRVLRVSFLSGFALELAASLSVALIAVTIGLRLVDGQLDLFTGLFVLLIAPEAYLPLRNVGAQFHAASEGVEVSQRVLDIISSPEEAKHVEALPAASPVVLTGPSGAGKTTKLRAMRSGAAMMLQKSTLLTGTVKENIVGFGSFQQQMLATAVKAAALDDVDLELSVRPDAPLSGGQIQRVCLARAVYSALASGGALLLDEPTSQIDPDRRRKIAGNLQQLAYEGMRLVVATHQAELIQIAAEEIKIG
jgi:ATP-binding cassette subfamily C protein CydD